MSNNTGELIFSAIMGLLLGIFIFALTLKGINNLNYSPESKFVVSQSEIVTSEKNTYRYTIEGEKGNFTFKSNIKYASGDTLQLVKK